MNRSDGKWGGGAEDLRFYLNELIYLTVPEKRQAEKLLETSPHMFVVVGLMLRCHRLLIGIRSLLDEQALDCARHLAREILEIVATAYWLIEKPENLEVFLGDCRRHLAQLISRVPSEAPRLHSFDAVMMSLVGKVENHRMPEFRERAFARSAEMQGMYKHMSEGIHVNFHTSQYGVTLENDELVFIDEPIGHEMDLQFARYGALLCGIMARRVHAILKWKHLDDFTEIVQALGDADSFGGSDRGL